MTSDYDDADSSGPALGMTGNRVRKLRAALAIQMLTGWRLSEARALEVACSKTLGHASAGLTERYLRWGNQGECQATEDATSVAELYAFYPAETPSIEERTRDQVAPSSPFRRVHEDIGRLDALSAHLGALREQLNDR